MKSSAPASIAATFSCSPLAVIITTGRKLVEGSARSARQTAYPSISGITMSSSTRSTGSAATLLERLPSRLRRGHAVAARGEDRLEQPDVLRKVVDDEDRRLLWRVHAFAPAAASAAATCRGNSRMSSGFAR